MDWNHFGRYLGGLRRNHGLLQKEVALNSGFTPSYIAALEGGRRPPPSTTSLNKIAHAIGASDLEKERLIRASNRMLKKPTSLAAFSPARKINFQ